MNLVTLNDLLPQAKKNRKAIPQFNINGYQWVESILRTANLLQTPIIIGVTDKNVSRLGGYVFICKMTKLMITEWDISIPVVLHLDHGQSVANCYKAIDAGFTSVMFDGSTLPFKENIELTRNVVEYAHKNNVSVEGEIGGIGGVEDGIIGNIVYAGPDECVSFVHETNIDALAAALGSVHGKYIGEPNLQFEVMGEINSRLSIPLVLHGASGISDSDLKKAINYGHAKINFNTELNLNRASKLRDLFETNHDIYDPKIIAKVEGNALQEVITSKLKLCYL